MITLNQIDKEKLSKALVRADGLELITTDVDGVYFVRSGEAMYMVVIAKQDGVATADCNCEGGKHDLVCKHAALALQAHKEKLETSKADELPVCHDCGASVFAYVEGNWFCANCIAEAAAEEAFKTSQMPEIDFDANPNEQQCQECLRLWVNNTEFAYKFARIAGANPAGLTGTKWKRPKLSTPSPSIPGMRKASHLRIIRR
jgi:hypothetical protein